MFASRSSARKVSVATVAMAGLILLAWLVRKATIRPDLAMANGDAAFSLILVSLAGWIVYRGTVARRRAENALRASEEAFRLFAEGVREYAIILLDCQGNVISWNAGAERLKGFKAEEIIGRSFSTFYPPEDVAAGKPALELKVAAEQGRWEGNGWRLRAKGKPFWANVLITALKDDAGNLRGFSKLTRDITERQQAEEVLLKAGALQRAIFESANFSSIERQFLRRSPRTPRVSFRSSTSVPSACWATRRPK